MPKSTVKIRKTTWDQFVAGQPAAVARVEHCLRLAARQLLLRTHPGAGSIGLTSLELRSRHADPLRSLHYVQGLPRPLAGGYTPPQWLAHIVAPLTATICVTPRPARSFTVLEVFPIRDLREELTALLRALEIVRREAQRAPTVAVEPTITQPVTRRLFLE